jgi:hypothetical protein
MMLRGHVRAVPVALFALSAGCASLANTEAQHRAEQRAALCQRANPFVNIASIDRDGRIRFWYSVATDRAAMLQCLADANRTGEPLPEPVPMGVPRP